MSRNVELRVLRPMRFCLGTLKRLTAVHAQAPAAAAILITGG